MKPMHGLLIASVGLLAAAALMMVLFFHAARLALVVFDPYMSSRPLAEALLRSLFTKLADGRQSSCCATVSHRAHISANHSMALRGRQSRLSHLRLFLAGPSPANERQVP